MNHYILWIPRGLMGPGDPPIVTLRLGSTLNPDDIKEGDDVYFECHVKANPPWRKLNWMHNGAIDYTLYPAGQYYHLVALPQVAHRKKGKVSSGTFLKIGRYQKHEFTSIPLSHNMSARIIRSNQSLVLQKVTRQSAGKYVCLAINEEGQTTSNELAFRVKFRLCFPANISTVVDSHFVCEALILCQDNDVTDDLSLSVYRSLTGGQNCSFSQLPCTTVRVCVSCNRRLNAYTVK
uniref:Ig-like domain-containing protein n=1 Tax=Timema monikensis TaxID=170555 RepID=A0A7R9E1Q5_9NEOP|nr:unnamed protein product [Timema monikensis]